MGDEFDSGTSLTLGCVHSSDNNWGCCVWADSIASSCTLKALKQPSAECLPLPSNYWQKQNTETTAADLYLSDRSLQANTAVVCVLLNENCLFPWVRNSPSVKNPVKVGKKHFRGAISLNLSDAYVPSMEKKAERRASPDGDEDFSCTN